MGIVIDVVAAQDPVEWKGLAEGFDVGEAHLVRKPVDVLHHRSEVGELVLEPVDPFSMFYRCCVHRLLLGERSLCGALHPFVVKPLWGSPLFQLDERFFETQVIIRTGPEVRGGYSGVGGGSVLTPPDGEWR